MLRPFPFQYGSQIVGEVEKGHRQLLVCHRGKGGGHAGGGLDECGGYVRR
jgi:hypothetical protein